MPLCQQEPFWIQVPEDDWWTCQAYSSGQRKLAEVQCYWKKSQILISAPLLTLITFQHAAKNAALTVGHKFTQASIVTFCSSKTEIHERVGYVLSVPFFIEKQ